MKHAKWTLWAIVLFASAGLVLAGCAGPEPAGPADSPPDSSERDIEKPVVPNPGEKVASKPRSKPRMPKTDEERLLALLGAERDAKITTAKNFFKVGKIAYKHRKFREAAQNFKMAARQAPENEDYRKWYMKTLWVLGDRKGEIQDIARRLIDERQVRIHQATLEMENLFHEAYRDFRDLKYEKAVSKFERVLETIKWFPYFFDQKGYENKTKHWIKLARLRAKQQARKRSFRERRIATEAAKSEEAHHVRYQRARIRAKYEQAKTAFEHKKWDKCQHLCKDILRAEPGHEEAMRLKQLARSYWHLEVQTKNYHDRVEQWAWAIDWVDRAGVPYMEILKYPPDEEWEKICQREVPVKALFASKESEAETKIRNVLQNRKVTVNFNETAFSDAIAFLRDITGLNFVVSAAAQELVADMPITMRLRDTKLLTALDMLLKHNDELTYKIKNGVIYITTNETEAEEIYLEFYNVSEIINKVPDFPAPEIGLRDWGGTRNVGTSLGTGSAGGGGGAILQLDDDEEGGESGGVGVSADALLELIETIIGESEGGETPTIHGGLLVVRQPMAAHNKIMKLLAMLRKTVGIMVTVECRFVDIQQNFLEEVGVDWRDLTGQITSTLTGDKSTGFQYRTGSTGQIDIRGALVNEFSQSLDVVTFPFNITNQGGSAIQFNYLQQFQIQAIFDAVQKKQKAHIMHSPRITVFNTQRSHMCCVTEESYIEDLEISLSGPMPLLNPVIGILRHGAIFEARPTVSYDKKYVMIECKPTLAIDNEALGRTQTLSIRFTTVPIELPYLTVQKLRSTIIVPDGGTVLLGGMRNIVETKMRSSVPLLGNIPILKFIFQRRGETILKRNVVILIRADITIISEEEEKRFGRVTYGKDW